MPQILKVGGESDTSQTHTRIIGAQRTTTTPILFLAAEQKTNFKIFSEKMKQCENLNIQAYYHGERIHAIGKLIFLLS